MKKDPELRATPDQLSTPTVSGADASRDSGLTGNCDPHAGSAADADPIQERSARDLDWTRFFLPREIDPILETRRAHLRETQVPDPSAGVESGAPRVWVLRNPSGRELRRASAALREGDWVYIEWRPSKWLLRPILRARLATAGLKPAYVCSVWPATAPTPRVWVPDAAPGAMRYFVEVFYPVASRREGLLSKIRGLAKRRLIRLVGLHTFRVFATKTRATGADTSFPILEWVRDQWPSWGLQPLSGELTGLLITEGYRDINKCVLLVFSEPSAAPVLAIKIPRTEAGAAGLSREAGALSHLDRLGGLAGAPRLLWSGRLGKLPALAQSALPGRPLSEIVAPGNHRQIALRVTEWLARLANRTARAGDGERWSRIVEPAVETFRAQLEPYIDTSAVERLGARPEAIAGLPIVVEHRDVSPWNITVSPDGAIGVLDWESAEISGLPGLDLLYFLAYLTFQVGEIPFRTASPELRLAYRHSLDRNTATGAVRAECLERYSALTGVAVDRLEALASLAWVIHSDSELRNFARDTSGELSAERVRESVFLALLEEEANRCASSGSVA